MNFSEALIEIKSGKSMTREGWNGKDMFVELQLPDEHSKMGLPYIYMRTAQAKLIPWVISHSDMLANDWEEA